MVVDSSLRFPCYIVLLLMFLKFLCFEALYLVFVRN